MNAPDWQDLQQHVKQAASLSPADVPHRDFVQQAYYLDLLALAATPATMSHDPNRVFLAEILSSRYANLGCLPADLGLGQDDFTAMCATFFPEATGLEALADAPTWAAIPEAEDLYQLLLQTRAGQRESELWMIKIVVAACAGRDHLWQDLGLFSRPSLSQLMQINFPTLAALNTGDMKWKKFIYKQLCSREGIYVCPAPSCSVCADFSRCFAPED